MKSILKRERELFNETWRLKQASFSITEKKGNKEERYYKSRELQRQEDEIYKKQQFFKNFIKEMEKIGK